jgi:plastocyanin
MSKGRSRSLTGVHAVIAAIAIAGLGAMGAAGADEAVDQTINADNGTAFTPAQVNIQVNESVTWTFDNPTNPHNVVAKPDSPTPWSTGDGFPTVDHPDVGPIPFPNEGTYTFFCQAHSGMQGAVIVGAGGGTPTPAPPTPTPTAPTPTPTQPSSGGGHVTTPAPTGGGDTVKPTVRNVSLRVKGRAVRVRFQLSERATVTVRIKRRSRVIKAASVQAAAGTRTVTLRSKRLTKGRYTVEIRARDAYGNRSSLATKRLLVRR